MGDTIWYLWECQLGARWSTTDYSELGDKVDCGFSDESCREHGVHQARCVDTTTDRTVAHDWFRRPGKKGEKNGLCNRKACMSPHNVVFYNACTYAYYCPSCAKKINQLNPEYKAQHGVDMVVQHDV